MYHVLAHACCMPLSCRRPLLVLSLSLTPPCPPRLLLGQERSRSHNERRSHVAELTSLHTTIIRLRDDHGTEHCVADRCGRVGGAVWEETSETCGDVTPNWATHCPAACAGKDERPGVLWPLAPAQFSAEPSTPLSTSYLRTGEQGHIPPHISPHIPDELPDHLPTRRPASLPAHLPAQNPMERERVPLIEPYTSVARHAHSRCDDSQYDADGQHYQVGRTAYYSSTGSDMMRSDIRAEAHTDSTRGRPAVDGEADVQPDELFDRIVLARHWKYFVNERH